MPTYVTTRAELEAALLDGGEVVVDLAPDDPPIALDGGGVTITVPLTSVTGGRFTVTGGPAFTITADDVALTGLRITGGRDLLPPGTTAGGADAYDPGQRLVHAVGTAVSPLTGLRIRDLVLEGSRADNVWLEWCHDSQVTGCRIERYLYSGVMIISGRRITVSHNHVLDAPLLDGPGQPVNTYGIALTDLDDDDEARTRDCIVASNHVSLIDWEGIDTHGGERITITGNHVTACVTGIALVSGNPTRTIAPRDCVVTGNTVSAIDARRPLHQGIVLYGLAGVPASATIVGNQVLGWTADAAFLTNYWDRTATLITGNRPPFVPWSAVVMGADYTANATYVPRYRVDGNTVSLRGGVIPKSGGVASRVACGQLTDPAAWPDTFTVVCLLKGSNHAAGTAQLAVTPTGALQVLYGTGTDAFTYFLHGSYQVP